MDSTIIGRVDKTVAGLEAILDPRSILISDTVHKTVPAARTLPAVFVGSK
ncbi:hypothetical protein MK139_02875 [bacterium]|nr:hypothetical protein [bacterium]